MLNHIKKSAIPVLISGIILITGSAYLTAGPDTKPLTASKDGFIEVDVMVIGGGVAGLSAAIPPAEELLKVVVIGSDRGQLDAQTPVGNVPGITFTSGSKYLNKLEKQVTRDGAHVETDAIANFVSKNGKFIVITKSGKKYKAHALIFATGSTPRMLGIPGEQDYRNKGISYEINEEAEGIFTNTTVAVIGSGDDAIRKANSALKNGAKKVYILARGQKLKAAKFRQERVIGKPGIEIIYQSTVEKIQGDGKKVNAIQVKTPQGIKTISVDHVLVAAGRTPNTQLLEGSVNLDKNKFVIVEGRSQRTSTPGIFAAGAIVEVEGPEYGQAAIMAATGMKAGYDAIQYIEQATK